MDNHDSVILIVEDDPVQQGDLAAMVASLGHQVLTAADGAEALEKIRSSPVNVVVTDLVMPGMDGLELLRQLATIGSHVPTIVLTGFGSVEQAISIVHDYKAFWFLEKPLQQRVLAALLERAIQRHRLAEENALLTRQLNAQGALGEMVGDSPAMREIFGLIRQLAPTQASVLITAKVEQEKSW
jgi:DNA-binding NtrC family response regulator